MEQSRAEKKENLQAKNKTKKREKTRKYETAKWKNMGRNNRSDSGNKKWTRANMNNERAWETMIYRVNI